MRQPPLLYYPNYYPNPDWLRAVLLFNDEVKRIVPQDVNLNDPPLLKELSEGLGVLSRISPSTLQITPDFRSFEWLDQAFSILRMENEQGEKAGEEKIRTIIELSNTGSFSFPDRVFLSDQKISHIVRELLEKHQLIDHLAQDFAGELGETNGSTLVHPATSNIILSFIADRIARDYGLTSITDQPLGYAMTSLSGLDIPSRPPAGISEGLLAAAFANVLVPKDIGSLRFLDYKILHQRSSDMRAAFAKFVQQCHDICKLDRIESEAVLQQRVFDCAKDVGDEFSKFKTGSSKALRSIRDWWPIGIGGVLALAKDFIPKEMALEFVALGIGIKAIEKAFAPSPDKTKEKVFSLAAGIGYDMQFLPRVEQMMDFHNRG